MTDAPRPQLRFKDPQIEMAHGAGGKATRRLVEGLLLPLLYSEPLAPLGDSAGMQIGDSTLAFTADGFVVNPLTFPGGSIGKIAVNGTLNDLAVAGARPAALLCTLVIEAGFPGAQLEAQIRAVADTARASGVPVVGGDTKVVEHGKADGLYITTAGIGVVEPRFALGVGRVQAGDRVLLSGPVGDHGITILLARGDLELEADLKTDSRPVWPLIASWPEDISRSIRWMRDPTRGGVASALNELARDTGLGILLAEEAIPVRVPVRGACEILGLDPLHIANEGQFLAVVSAATADDALEILQQIPGGSEARLIGTVTAEHRGRVISKAPYGGSRVVDMLVGDPLPRIC